MTRNGQNMAIYESQILGITLYFSMNINLINTNKHPNKEIKLCKTKLCNPNFVSFSITNR